MKGFTLIEVLVVASITVMIGGLLISNFSRTRLDLNQATLIIQDAIREAQSMALSGALYGRPGTYRCGYGVHFLPDGVQIYAGPDSSGGACSSQDRNYNGGTDQIVRDIILSNTAIEIPSAPDIFFEPPNPKTYINDVSTPNTSAVISVRKKGAPCPALFTDPRTPDCRQIYVSTAGRIQTQ